MSSKDGTPNRQFMDDPKIKWRTTKPDFSKVDAVFKAERTRHHPPGSLAKLIEDLVKTFEMEATHKPDPEVETIFNMFTSFRLV